MDKNIWLKEAEKVSRSFFVRCKECYSDNGNFTIEDLIEEAEFLLFKYTEEGFFQYSELCEAKKIKKKTNNFATVPLELPMFTPLFSSDEIDSAKNMIEEYDKLRKNLRIWKRKLQKRRVSNEDK